MLAATCPDIGGETFQIASNKETTVGEMTQELVGILKSQGISDIELINSEKRLGDVARNFSDTTKARTQLGWQPKIFLTEGLKMTVQYFLQEFACL